jgi:hypothetical protein
MLRSARLERQFGHSSNRPALSPVSIPRPANDFVADGMFNSFMEVNAGKASAGSRFFDLSELWLSASYSPSQPFNSHPSGSGLTGMRLWMRQRVVASDRKFICLASAVTRHE